MAEVRKKKAKEIAWDVSKITAFVALILNAGFDRFIKTDSAADIKTIEAVVFNHEKIKNIEETCAINKTDIAVLKVLVSGNTSSITSIGIKQDKIHDMLYELKHK